MRLKKRVAILSLLLFLTLTLPAKNLIGIWETALGESHIEIYQQECGLYQGKMVWVKDQSEEKQQFVGSMIIRNFKKRGENSYKGTIYDPSKNHTYKCNASLKGLDTLELRGYIGIPLLGRMERWIRVK